MGRRVAENNNLNVKEKITLEKYEEMARLKPLLREPYLI